MQTLRFGLLGFGHFGKHYARLLGSIPAVELVTTANNAIESSNIVSDPTIDCVVIATPPSTHKGLIEAALRSGKHVLVEKPMVLNSAEAAVLKDSVSETVTIMVAYQYVYNDYVRKLKDLIVRGRLGTVAYVVAQNWYFGPLRQDIGSFGDAVGHELSMIDYLLNPGALAKSSYQSFSITKPGGEDFSAATVEYASGLRAHLTVSWFMPEKSRQLIVVGDKGVAVFNDTATEKLRVYDRPYPTEPMTHSSNFMKDLVVIEPENVSVSAGEPLQNQLEYFVACVREKQKPITDFAFGEKIVSQIETIQHSL